MQSQYNQSQSRRQEAGHFRRYHGYDYSRGACLFLSFNVEPKEDILGRVEAPGTLVHNEWGRLVEAKVAEIAARHAPLRVMKHVIMPNHAHLLVRIPPRMENPLVALGAFVSAFKQSTSMLLQYRIIKAGHKILGHVYRPTGGEPSLFAEKRYLLLSRQSEPDQSRRAGWLDLNANLAAMADKAVYARMEGGRLRW